MNVSPVLMAAALWGAHVLSGSPQPIAARLTVSVRAPAHASLAIQEFGGAERRPIRRYDRDMTKLLHLIVVDDSLETFMHVHPVLNSAGIFNIALALPHGGRWHFYADGMPHNFSRQVFRFDVELPAAGAAPRSSVPSERRVVSVGPYLIALASTVLPAGKTTMLAIHIERNGAPAKDLRPYLGARAHAVLIGPGFSYIHAHAMSNAMSSAMATGAMPMGMSMGGTPSRAPPPDDGCGNDATGMSLVELPPNAHVAPDMAVMLRPVQPGRYHLWLQFRDRAAVYTAPFLIQVRGRSKLNK